MSALNQTGSHSVKKATSHNGNVQFAKNVEQQLYEIIAMTMFGNDNYYETNNDRLTRLKDLVNQVVAKGNLDFISNTAIYVRTEMNIRSMPIVLVVLFAEALRKNNKHYDGMRRTVCSVIRRVDQITDMYAFALATFGDKKAIPAAIKRGVADAFNKFNEYGFAKYNRSGSVKLSDVLRMVHPKGKNIDQGKLFEKIMKDTLEIPYTWETELSTNGQKLGQERKSDKVLWTELINSGKVGYMALLRNLRNIIDAQVGREAVKVVTDRLSNAEEVAKSRQLPFRFLNAINSIEDRNDNRMNNALYKAVDCSLGNLPQIGERVWIIIDCSGSMSGGYYGYGNSSRKNMVAPIKTATLFAGALAKANCDAEKLAITMFSDNAKAVSVNTNDSVMSIAKRLEGEVYGGGTNLTSALNMYPSLGFKPDTIILFSDMQVDRLGSGYGYRQRNDDPSTAKSVLNMPGIIKVAVNLAAYESTPASELNGWYQLAGWSDKVFDFVPAMREKTSIVKHLSQKFEG